MSEEHPWMNYAEDRPSTTLEILSELADAFDNGVMSKPDAERAFGLVAAELAVYRWALSTFDEVTVEDWAFYRAIDAERFRVTATRRGDEARRTTGSTPLEALTKLCEKGEGESTPQHEGGTDGEV